MTWDNPEELEEYIKKLQKAANNLTTENRKLRKVHNVICEKVTFFVFKLGSDKLVISFEGNQRVEMSIHVLTIFNLIHF